MVDTPLPNLARLRRFVADVAGLFDAGHDDAALVEQAAPLVSALVAVDDWLPPAYAVPDPERYRQYLLHCDGAERFSVVSFVWGPGQATPIHDHRVWGVVGVLRGAELVDSFVRNIDGTLRAQGEPQRLERGAIDRFGPALGDIHRVANAHDDRVSISIHLYGANIGAVERATYDGAGRPKRFISGYANAELPNLWDRSAA
ncbi:cysteine dioxygenase [Sphingomonas bacterium]|uniref:cysteine dioxygenase family protein n=1 Tax=Sphingomonas bacterium TaxID=1895847 RepID=UPI00157633FF|nr:cysteine dioxygenase [Sphingomonas bacterium]